MERRKFLGQGVYLQIEYSNKLVSGSTLNSTENPESSNNQCLLIFKMGAVKQEDQNIELIRSFYRSIDDAAVLSTPQYRTSHHPGYQMAKFNLGQTIKRPGHIRTGEHMTCAIVEEADWFEDPYDFSRAVDKLLEFQQFLFSISEPY